MKNLIKVDPRIKPTKDLLDGPHIIRVNNFDEEDVKEFSKAMTTAHNTGQPVIPIVIDSRGGHADSLIAMIAEIENAEVPVATICVGKAMSCGAILLSCGTEGYRFMDPLSRAMIHDVSVMQWGKTEEVKAGAKEVERLNKLVYQKMAKNCGQELDYFLKIVHDKGHADWFLTAKESKKHKLVNHLRIPTFRTTVNVEMVFE